jgi:uncharacterized protein
MAEGVLSALRDSQPLSVDVSDLLRTPGATKRVRHGSKMEGLAVPLAWVRDDSEVMIDLRLDALVDGVHVSGSIEGDVTRECRRCLTDVEEHVSLAVSEVFAYPGDEDGDEEAYPIADERIDLGPLVRDVVVLALPLNPLCRPDCKGLCPVCGVQRNDVDCGHSGEPTDIRWGPLEDLRRRMEG